MCWCGLPSLHGRSTCSDNHAFEALKRKSKEQRLCRCGKPARPKRATCSDECWEKYQGVPKNGVKRTKDIECVVCGKAFRSYGRATCSPECSEALRESRLRKCVVCGKPCGTGRNTCSSECAKKRAPQTTIGVRSDSVRAKRRRHAKHAYKRPDKAEVIASLMLKQAGRCAVCGSDGELLGNGKRGLVLDHDHATGEPRAMLCTRCNAALGLMRESTDLIVRLGAYAQRWLPLSTGESS